MRAATRVVCCVPLLALLCYAQSISPPKQPATLEVCDLVEGQSTGVVRLRGTGRLIGDVFLLLDLTCPSRLPDGQTFERMVRVKPVRFARMKDSMWFERMIDRFERPVIQLEVEGRSSCVKNFTVTFDSDKRAVKGNGYGRSGLHRCEIQDANMLGLWYAGNAPVAQR